MHPWRQSLKQWGGWPKEPGLLHPCLQGLAGDMGSWNGDESAAVTDSWFWRFLKSCLLLFFSNVLFFFFYCCSIIVVLVFPPLISPALPSPPNTHTHLSLLRCCLCPWVLYRCSLTWPCPFFPCESPPPPSLVTVSLFFILMSLVLFCSLLCFIG